MFCRFCGKEIPNDSSFCEHCGSNLTNVATKNINTQKDASISSPQKAKQKISIPVHKILNIVYYVGVLVFVFTFGPMAPGWGFVAFLSYIGGIVLYVRLMGMLLNRVQKNKAKTDIIFFVSLVCIIAICMVSLTMIYNAKYDRVMNSMPADGTVKVEVSLDEDFYTYSQYGPSMVYDPSSSIKIGNRWYDSGGVITLQLNKSYPIEMKCHANSASATAKGTINLNFNDILSGYSTSIHMSHELWLFSAEVTAVFKRVVDFWEVVFY